MEWEGPQLPQHPPELEPGQTNFTALCDGGEGPGGEWRWPNTPEEERKRLKRGWGWDVSKRWDRR